MTSSNNRPNNFTISAPAYRPEHEYFSPGSAASGDEPFTPATPANVGFRRRGATSLQQQQQQQQSHFVSPPSSNSNNNPVTDSTLTTSSLRQQQEESSSFPPQRLSAEQQQQQASSTSRQSSLAASATAGGGGGTSTISAVDGFTPTATLNSTGARQQGLLLGETMRSTSSGGGSPASGGGGITTTLSSDRQQFAASPSSATTMMSPGSGGAASSSVNNSSSSSFVGRMFRRGKNAVVGHVNSILSGLKTLWDLGDQIRQVYNEGTPESERLADRKYSKQLSLAFGAWCLFVAAKDVQLLSKIGLLGSKMMSSTTSSRVKN